MNEEPSIRGILDCCILALRCQEDTSALCKRLYVGNIPSPDDPIYEKWLGKWDGYKSPELRHQELHIKRKDLRAEALKRTEAFDVMED